MWYPGKTWRCGGGLKPIYSPVFASALKTKIWKWGVHVLVSALPKAGAFTCLLVRKQMDGPAYAKSYWKLCLLFSDSCNALPKFRRIGWKALRSMCSNLVDSSVVLLVNELVSRWSFSHCLGIFYYFIQRKMEYIGGVSSIPVPAD